MWLIILVVLRSTAQSLFILFKLTMNQSAEVQTGRSMTLLTGVMAIEGATTIASSLAKMLDDDGCWLSPWMRGDLRSGKDDDETVFESFLFLAIAVALLSIS